MVNTEFTHICSATVQNSSGTLLVSACGASGRRSVVAIRRMTVPRIALVMAIRQVDAAMRHFSFQHQSPIEALGVGMRVSRPGGDAGHALRSEERRVGKEGVSTCRSRGWPYHIKTQRLMNSTHGKTR